MMSSPDQRTCKHLDPALIESVMSPRSGPERRAILMFSGGRDSTLAALQLRESGYNPVLVTISSSHLTGRENVRRRVRELARHLSPETPWILIRQPDELKTDTSFYEQTCLPCHHAYVVAGAAVAAKAGLASLAFGYAAYQNTWPEQTPLAVVRLARVLARHGTELILPVYNLASRDEAIAQLEAKGLSAGALEQKCIRQITNVELEPHRLRQQIDFWEKAIDTSIRVVDTIKIQVLEALNLGSVL
jgi:hypothetical protein